MGLSPHQALSVVVIICFIPALVIAGWLCVFRGIGQQWGWLYLFILALTRVVGCSLQIAAEKTDSNGLYSAATVFSSSGLMALILVMLEIMQRVKQRWLEHDPIPSIVWRVLHWSQWAAFILSIIAISTSSDRLWKAAIMIMAVMFAIQAFVSIVFATRLKHLLRDRNLTLILLLSSIPFLAIRVLYAILKVFVTSGSVFGGSRPDVVAVALMQYLMEIIVVAMYLVAAFSITSWKDERSTKDEEGFRMTRGSVGAR